MTIRRRLLSSVIVFVLSGTSVLAVYNDFNDPQYVPGPLQKGLAPETELNTAQPDQSLPLGQMLYENHCRVCHDSVVHIRSMHKARSIADIRQWVHRWVTHLQLKWSETEKEQVVEYLNNQFYKF